MSTFLGEQPTSILKSEEELQSYFHAFAKPREAIRVGLEAEFFPVYRETGRALPYSGPDGVEALLGLMAELFHYETILENHRIIALKRDDLFVTLEPGGQMELSAPPVVNVFDIDKQLSIFLCELRALKQHFPHADWLAFGIHPFTRLEEIEWVPKKRYNIMAGYMGSHGTLSHHMMKRTATNQVNFDYTSEDNAMESLRVAFLLSPVVSALFANASFSDGHLNGFASARLDIWNHTDPDRTGLLRRFLEPHRKFSDYLDYLLDMPVMFVVRNGDWISLDGIRFRDYIREGYHGLTATLSDFELHLSTAFPEVRLKQYMEIRGVDCQHPDLIPAVAAFWKGILYHSEARKKAAALFDFASPDDVMALHQEVPHQGLQARLAGQPIFPIAKQLVDISCASLGLQKKQRDTDECHFLTRIRRRITDFGKSPGEQLAEKWRGEFQQNPARLIESLSIG